MGVSSSLLTPKVLVPVIAGVVGLVGIGVGAYAVGELRGQSRYERFDNAQYQRGYGKDGDFGYGDRMGMQNGDDMGNRMGKGSHGMGMQTGMHMYMFDDSVPTTPITDSAKNAVLKALDDEHKAYATYLVIIDKFGEIKPFSNITRAEQMHIDALVQALSRYSVAIPENPYLDTEIAIEDSVEANCAVGATLEQENVDLYNSLLKDVEGFDDIILVFEHLKDASNYNHKPALERCSM